LRRAARQLVRLAPHLQIVERDHHVDAFGVNVFERTYQPIEPSLGLQVALRRLSKYVIAGSRRTLIACS